jgi:hypothetical protein
MGKDEPDYYVIIGDEWLVVSLTGGDLFCRG